MQLTQAKIDFDRIENAIEFIKSNIKSQPNLEEIADHVNLSKFHFQKLFQDWVGISPKSFSQYLTIKHAKDLLKKGKSTLDTAYSVGLSGNGRLHDAFVKIEAMSPGQYKNGGDTLDIYYGFYETPFGEILMAKTPIGICKVDFVTDRETEVLVLKKEWPNAQYFDDQGAQQSLVDKLFWCIDSYNEQIPLHLKGTSFQIKVWEVLLKIPCGELVSYGDISQQINMPNASRAVGSAIGRNPVAFLIPCHRVIRREGEIGQYKWGCARKSAMVGFESAILN